MFPSPTYLDTRATVPNDRPITAVMIKPKITPAMETDASASDPSLPTKNISTRLKASWSRRVATIGRDRYMMLLKMLPPVIF